MNTRQILDFSRELIQTHLDSYKGNLGDTALLSVCNRALLRVARRIRHYDGKITWTLTNGTAEYTMFDTPFSKRVVKPYAVYHNSKRYSLIGWAEFEQRYPDYRWNNTAGSPSIFVWKAGKMLVHVPPDVASAAYTTYVAAECYPADMSESALTSSPDLPLEVHEGLCYLASYLAAHPTASDEVAFMQMRTNLKQAFDDIQIVREMNEELILGKWDMGHDALMNV